LKINQGYSIPVSAFSILYYAPESLLLRKTIISAACIQPTSSLYKPVFTVTSKYRKCHNFVKLACKRGLQRNSAEMRKKREVNHKSYRIL